MTLATARSAVRSRLGGTAHGSCDMAPRPHGRPLFFFLVRRVGGTSHLVTPRCPLPRATSRHFGCATVSASHTASLFLLSSCSYPYSIRGDTRRRPVPLRCSTLPRLYCAEKPCALIDRSSMPQAPHKTSLAKGAPRRTQRANPYSLCRGGIP